MSTYNRQTNANNIFVAPALFPSKPHVQVDVTRTWAYKSKGFIPPLPSGQAESRNHLNLLIQACNAVDKDSIHADTTDTSCWQRPDDWNDSYLDLESSMISECLSPEKKYIESSLSKLNRTRPDGPLVPGVMKPIEASEVPQLRANTVSAAAVKPPVVVKKPVVIKTRIPQRKPKPAAEPKPHVKKVCSKTHRSDMLVSHPPCVSCKCRKSPCWRPSWSIEAGQLCNSCGLRYRKMHVKCSNKLCRHIPSKAEIYPDILTGTKVSDMSCSMCNERLQKD